MKKKVTKVEEMVINTTPRRVTDDTHPMYDFPCEGTFSQIIAFLESKAGLYGVDATIKIESAGDDYSCCDSYSHAVDVKVTTYRDETEREIEKRVTKAKKDKEKAAVQRDKRKEKEVKEKQKQAEDEIKLLKRLQEKYKGYGFEQVNTEG